MEFSTYLNVKTCDVGSLPDPFPLQYPVRGFEGTAFENAVIKGFIDKIEAGIHVPTYPQFRDMNEMFLEMIDGVGRARGGYMILEPLSPGKLVIPEIRILADNIDKIKDKVGEKPSIRICITSPYTLSHSFTGIQDKLWLWEELGNILSEIAGETLKVAAVFKSVMVSLDEPVLGVVDDPLLDIGSEGSRVLASVIDKILSACKSRGAETCMHLHSTSSSVIWELHSLDVIESHVDDPLYNSSELIDKVSRMGLNVKAAICKTNYDRLLDSKLETYGLTVETAWKRIRSGDLNPVLFLEDVNLMRERLEKTVRAYGSRVKYAGPECGLRSFPTYDAAIKYLRMVSEAVGLVG